MQKRPRTSDRSDGGIISLNVGGTRFTASKVTLRTQHSFFERMLNDDMAPGDTDESGAIFIDRDPEHFQHILSFLRCNQTNPEMISSHTRHALLRECDFYALPLLENQLRGGFHPAQLREQDGEMEEIRLSILQDYAGSRFECHNAIPASSGNSYEEAGLLLDIYGEALNSFKPATREGLGLPLLLDYTPWPANSASQSIVPTLEEFRRNFFQPGGKSVRARSCNSSAHEGTQWWTHSGGVEEYLGTVPEELQLSNHNHTKTVSLYHVLAGLNMDNLLIAGGAVLSALTGQTQGYENTDIDIFVFGLSCQEARVKLEAVSSHLCSWLLDFVMVRTREAVTFVHQVKRLNYDQGNRSFLPNIQIMLTAFSSVYHVLSTSDLDCCAVGYDGARVLTTPQGRRAINHRTNIYHPLLHAAEFRVCKYALRGFAFAVPGYEPMRLKPLTELRQESVQELTGLAQLVHLHKWRSPHSITGDIDMWLHYEIKHGVSMRRRGTKHDRALLGSYYGGSNSAFWSFVEDSIEEEQIWEVICNQFAALAEEQDIRSTIRWDVVAKLWKPNHATDDDHIQRGRGNYPGLNHPNPALVYIQYMLENPHDSSTFDAFNRLRALSTVAVCHPNEPTSIKYREDSPNDSSGIGWQSLGQVVSWIPTRDSPWRWDYYQEFGEIHQYPLIKLLTYRAQVGHSIIDSSHENVMFRRIENADDDQVQQVLSGRSGFDDVSLDGSEALGMAPALENTSVEFITNPGWLTGMQQLQLGRTCASWFATAYDPDMFDIDEAALSSTWSAEPIFKQD